MAKQFATAFASALSPPGTAPPMSAQQEAATLVQRFTGIVNGLARGQTTIEGQKNEISGTLLDAKSAKEPPAPATTTPPNASTLAIDAVVSSLLSSAKVAVQTTPPAPQLAPDPAKAQPASSTPAALPMLTSLANFAAPPPPMLPHAGTAPEPPVRNESPGMQSAPPPSNAGQNLDLLGRMIARAAGTDASLTAARAAAGEPSAPATFASASLAPAAFASATLTGASTPGQLDSNQMLRLTAALTAAAESGAGSSGSHLSSGFGSPNGRDSSSFGNQTSNAALGFTLPSLHGATNAAAPSAAAPSPQPLDVQALAEQMIAGMHLRTASDGSSQMQIKLMPEHLGEVAVRLTVSGTNVTANVVAQNADTRTALLANHQQLARSLADSGLKLTGFSVDLSGGKQQNRGSDGKGPGLGRRFTIHEIGAPAAQPTEALVSSNAGMLSADGNALYNYLA
ncbi:MAG: hypothetical protein HKL92_04505 [Candidatus Eremiobacteraeota bacterium]|nr:hypothetical protein [Candidatus Eremiobacteraeota bacterium]